MPVRKRIAETTDRPTLRLLFSTEDKCYKWLEYIMWGDTPVCPTCGATRKVYKLHGKKRKHHYKCNVCPRIFNVKTGTVLQGTRRPLRDWVFTKAEGEWASDSSAAVEAAWTAYRWGVRARSDFVGDANHVLDLEFQF